MVKYSAAQSQNATLPCMNLSQCTTVATPIRDANMVTGMNPPPIACQIFPITTRTKK